MSKRTKPLRDVPLSVRLTEEMRARLEEVANRTGISRHTLAQMAIEAAVEAIEKNGWRAVIPPEMEMEFKPTHVAVPRIVAEKYPEHEPQFTAIEEKQERPKRTRKSSNPLTSEEQN